MAAAAKGIENATDQQRQTEVTRAGGGAADNIDAVVNTAVVNTEAVDTAVVNTEAVNTADPMAAAVDALLANPADTRVVLDGVADQPTTVVGNGEADTLGDSTTAKATVAAMHAELAATMNAMHGQATTAHEEQPAGTAMSDHEIDQLLADVGADAQAASQQASCTPACGADGACVDGRCACAALISGPACRASVTLSWPTLPDPKSAPVTAYRGGLVLSKTHNPQAPLTVRD